MKDKVAIITGASRGIGAAIAKELASRGANVVINYLSSEDCAIKVQAECRAFGVKAEIFRADVSDFKQAKELVDFAAGEFGKVDILVNNAGRTMDTLCMRMSEEQFDGVISANLKSAFNMTRHILPIMTKARFGRIINIASVAGVSGNAGQANYSASKAGLIGMTKSVSKEVGSRNITVNAVAPGFIETDMTEKLPDKVKEYAVTASSLRRFGKAEEVARAVCFLAGEDSSFITGQTLSVDGGLSL